MENKSKDILFKSLAGFIGVLTILIIYSMFFGPIQSFQKSLYFARTLNVSASDKATVTPDIATLSFSVVTEGINIGNITDQNNTKINNAIAMIKEKGVDVKDIQTTEYSLTPVYTQPTIYDASFVPTIAKYSLTQSVSVKIRDFKNISPILDALTPMGINRIGNVSFGVDDPEKYLTDARARAFQKALDKATAIAKQNGVSIGKVINVSEYAPANYEKYASGMGGVSLSAAPSFAAPDIQPGSQELNVNVNVTYEIK
jgi:uncharacterized protein YggE